MVGLARVVTSLHPALHCGTVPVLEITSTPASRRHVKKCYRYPERYSSSPLPPRRCWASPDPRAPLSRYLAHGRGASRARAVVRRTLCGRGRPRARALCQCCHKSSVMGALLHSMQRSVFTCKECLHVPLRRVPLQRVPSGQLRHPLLEVGHGDEVLHWNWPL